MDKREALELYLKVHDECVGSVCKDCVFREIYNCKEVCVLDLIHRDSVAESVRAKLKDMKEKQEEHSVPPKNVEVKTTFYAKAPISAEEFEKQLKALLPKKLALEPLPKEDTAIKMPISSKPENVNCPKHYCKGGVESIDFVKAAVSNLSGFEAVCVANIIKYMWRYKEKNGLEDVMKAAKYLEWLQEEVKNEQGLDRK